MEASAVGKARGMGWGRQGSVVSSRALGFGRRTGTTWTSAFSWVKLVAGLDCLQ